MPQTEAKKCPVWYRWNAGDTKAYGDSVWIKVPPKPAEKVKP